MRKIGMRKTCLGHAWFIDWWCCHCADFVQPSIWLRFHMCIFSSLLRRHCLAGCIQSLWLLKSLLPSVIFPWALGVGVALQMCHLGFGHTNTFEFWPAIPALSSFCCKEKFAIPRQRVSGCGKGSITFLQGCAGYLIQSDLSWTHIHMCSA